MERDLSALSSPRELRALKSSQHACHASYLGTDNTKLPRVALRGCSPAYIVKLAISWSLRAVSWLFELQVRQHAHTAVDMLRGYGDDFLADAMKFEIDAHVAYGQIADAQRPDADG